MSPSVTDGAFDVPAGQTEIAESLIVQRLQLADRSSHLALGFERTDEDCEGGAHPCPHSADGGRAVTARLVMGLASIVAL